MEFLDEDYLGITPLGSARSRSVHIRLSLIQVR